MIAHPSADLYGSDRVLLESVTALAETGWEVTVTLPADGALVGHLLARGARVRYARTLVLRKALLRPRGLLAMMGLAPRALLSAHRMIRAVNPDLVYVNTVTIPLWLLAARMSGRPGLAHVHEAEADVPRPVGVALAAPLLLAATVVVNSRATGDVITRSIPALERRIRLIYNGVPGPERVAELAAERPEVLHVVLVGRLSPRKGTDVAIAALGVLTQRGVAATLELVGSVFPGYEWYEQQLRTQVEQLGLQSMVTFTGFVADVWPAYARADIALVPSRVEPFGNAAVEAQLVGVPVIVSRVQGLIEAVDDGRAGRIVAAEDPDALADAIQAYAQDWAATREQAGRARSHAAARFAPRRYAEQIVLAAQEQLSVFYQGDGPKACSEN